MSAPPTPPAPRGRRRQGGLVAAVTLWVLLATALVVAAQRGVPAEDRPTVLPTTTSTTSPVASTVPPARAGTRTVMNVYLLQGDRLVRVRRLTPEVSTNAALQALQAGPTEAEAESGLRSALVPGTRLVVAERRDDLVVVDIGPEVAETEPAEQVLALAQVVWTVTSTPGVDRVLFTFQGRRIDAPGADGRLRSAPLRRDDFATLRRG